MELTCRGLKDRAGAVNTVKTQEKAADIPIILLTFATKSCIKYTSVEAMNMNAKICHLFVVEDIA